METITVGKNDGGIRLDKFLSKCFKTMPKSLMYKYIRTKRIKLNGKRVKEDTVLTEGDVLTFFIDSEFFGDKTNEELKFTKLKESRLVVVYEDENILIADKPSGLIVHSDENEELNTLINHIKLYLYNKGEYVPSEENSFAPALCNRIDRNTSGLVIAAKNAITLKVMNEKIKARELDKIYLCAVHGIPQKREATLRGFLEKISAENRVVVHSRPTRNAKESVTKYKVAAVNKAKNLSLLEVELITGRTHQIRSQLAEAGYPLLGDGKYAVNKKDRKAGYSSQALSAHKLTFKFVGEPTHLDYLNGRTFYSSEPEFLSLF